MNKIVIAVIGIILAITVTFIIISSRNQPQPNPISNSATRPTSKPVENVKKYEDPSGFAFDYPDTLIVSPVTPLANSYYAHVEAKSSGQVGKASIIIESTIVKSLDSWKKTNKQLPILTTKTKLADLDAIEYVVDNTKTLAAIDNGTLITISVPNDNFWNNAYTKIVSSFAFVQPTTAVSNDTSTTSGGGDDITFEGEETIE
ncbi:MAG: PsbP-related protein [bacterium]|nr:PsbP-related protein [bacterium]